MTDLHTWLKANKVTSVAFARMGGWSRFQVHKWRHRIHCPSLVDAFRIEELTRGEVPARSFLQEEAAA